MLPSDKVETLLIKYHGAIGRNDIKAVYNFLVKTPELLNTPEGIYHETSIFKAADCKRTEMLGYLINEGGDCDVLNYNAITPLVKCLYKKKVIPFEIIELLMRETDLSLIKKSPPGFPPGVDKTNIYHILCYTSDKFDIVELRILLDIIRIKNRSYEMMGEKIDINSKDEWECTPFSIALVNNKNRRSVLHMLIDFGAEIPVSSSEEVLNLEKSWYGAENVKMFNSVRNHESIVECKILSILSERLRFKKCTPKIELPEEIHRIILGYLQPLERCKTGFPMWGKIPLTFWDRIHIYL